MACMSQFYILSPRGDTIISREYRNDVMKGTAEIFFRKVKFWKGGDAPPAFNIDGINYIYMKENGIYFMCTTKYNVSPNFILELLQRLAKCFKDYCGILTEESLRKNFVLIYELLDETIDYGYPQDTSTESLKSFVYNEPVVVDLVRSANFKMPALGTKTTPSSAVHKPVTMDRKAGKQRNEIFVDIVERVTMLFNNNGYTLNSEIDGCIQMKSFLTGNPELRLALNEDLVVGKGSGNAYGAVVLDDCNFHECAQLDEFEDLRTLHFTPPEGEFTLMNYRITGEFIAPFRVTPYLEELSATQISLQVSIQADIPDTNYAANMTVCFPVPKSTNGVSFTLGQGAAAAGQNAEFKIKENKVFWTIKKFQGGSEHTLRAKINLKEPASTNVRRETGPISLNFEIPMYNVSNVVVRYLRIAEKHKSYNPYRWVRYVTRSKSYVCRLT